MGGVSSISGDVSSAAAALAGLILVFLGAAAAGYDGFEPTARKAVRKKYQVRVWLAVAGILLALAAAGAGLAGKAAQNECLAWIALLLLAASALMVVLAAVLLALDVS